MLLIYGQLRTNEATYAHFIDICLFKTYFLFRKRKKDVRLKQDQLKLLLPEHFTAMAAGELSALRLKGFMSPSITVTKPDAVTFMYFQYDREKVTYSNIHSNTTEQCSNRHL